MNNTRGNNADDIHQKVAKPDAESDLRPERGKREQCRGCNSTADVHVYHYTEYHVEYRGKSLKAPGCLRRMSGCVSQVEFGGSTFIASLGSRISDNRMKNLQSDQCAEFFYP